MQTPHGIHAAADGTVWVTDFAANADGTKGHQVHQFSADGELLMSLEARPVRHRPGCIQSAK